MYRLSLSHEVYSNSNADVNVAVTRLLAVQTQQLRSTYNVWRAAVKPGANLKCITANNLRSLLQTAQLASCCFPPQLHLHLRDADWQCGARIVRRRTRFRFPNGWRFPMFWKTWERSYETSPHVRDFLDSEDAVTDLPESFVFVQKPRPFKTDGDEPTIRPHRFHTPPASFLY